MTRLIRNQLHDAVSGSPAGVVAGKRSSSSIRPTPRRGLSRVEAALYLGISPSKFDELRKANRIPPPKVLDARLIFTIERLDEFLDALPDESQTDNGLHPVSKTPS